MVSVVNGYVCATSCDVEAAKKGKDPNAPPGAPANWSANWWAKTDKTSGFDRQPVTILDGALKNLTSANTVTATPPSASPRPRVNRLA